MVAFNIRNSRINFNILEKGLKIMDLNTVIEFVNDFLINVVNLLDQLFFTSLTIVIGTETYTLVPIGLLIGGIGLLIGLVRRII